MNLEDISLDHLTTRIKDGYARYYPGMKGLGFYWEDDWRRIAYISTLLPEAKSVLDVGTGGGHFLNLLLALGKFENVIGCDIRKHSKFVILENGYYQMVYLTVAMLPFKDKSIDVVTCMEVLEHLDKESFILALAELHRISRFLIMTVPYNQPEPLPSYHKLRFTDTDLITYFPNGQFTLLKKIAKGTIPWMVIQECS